MKPLLIKSVDVFEINSSAHHSLSLSKNHRTSFAFYDSASYTGTLFHSCYVNSHKRPGET